MNLFYNARKPTWGNWPTSVKAVNKRGVE